MKAKNVFLCLLFQCLSDSYSWKDLAKISFDKLDLMTLHKACNIFSHEPAITNMSALILRKKKQTNSSTTALQYLSLEWTVYQVWKGVLIKKMPWLKSWQANCQVGQWVLLPVTFKNLLLHCPEPSAKLHTHTHTHGKAGYKATWK